MKGRYVDYRCSEGHEMSSPWPEARVLEKGCLAVVKGSPCKGTLRRVSKR